jgi:mannosyltransferase OCH1-like enzyme
MKIIHQIWFDFGNGRFPSEKQVTTDFIARKNPNYEYMFWDLESAIKLTRKHYPKYCNFLMQDTNRNIIKCDFFRYVLMLHFGGFYFDLDFIVLQNLDNTPFIQSNSIVLTEECYKSRETHQSLHNGFLYSKTPGHIFWKNMCDEIVDRNPEVYSNISEAQVYELTGTKYLCEKWRNCQKEISLQIAILPFHILCNHWFVSKGDNYEKHFYTTDNERKTIARPGCSWTFLNLDDVINYERTLVRHHAVAICAILPHGSFWKT